jgi:outer membrane protein assembly factor BamE
MTRNQVRFALGTPLVIDPFRTDRWDYVYLYQKAGVLTEQRRIAVIFKDDKLVRIDGDVVAAAPGTTTPAAKTGNSVAPQVQPEKKQNPDGR